MTERLRTYRKPPGFLVVAPPAEGDGGAGQRPAPPVPEAEIVKLQRRQEICVWCANRRREVCGSCRVEGGYGGLEPDTLERGEQGPELPPYRELRQWPAEARLAMMYLVIHYLRSAQ